MARKPTPRKTRGGSAKPPARSSNPKPKPRESRAAIPKAATKPRKPRKRILPTWGELAARKPAKGAKARKTKARARFAAKPWLTAVRAYARGLVSSFGLDALVSTVRTSSHAGGRVHWIYLRSRGSDWLLHDEDDMRTMLLPSSASSVASLPEWAPLVDPRFLPRGWYHYCALFLRYDAGESDIPGSERVVAKKKKRDEIIVTTRTSTHMLRAASDISRQWGQFVARKRDVHITSAPEIVKIRLCVLEPSTELVKTFKALMPDDEWRKNMREASIESAIRRYGKGSGVFKDWLASIRREKRK